MAGGRSLPVYTTGSVAVASVSGTWTVTGTGTNFIAPDGVPNYTALAGDLFVIPNAGFGTVASVASATSLTLDFWTGTTVSSGSGYKIYRYEGLPSSAVVALINQLLTLLSDSNPPPSITLDTGAVRAKLDDDGSGDMRLRVRSSTAAGGDGAYLTALTINAFTGAVSMPLTMAITPTLEMFFQTGDPDYTNAFARGLALFPLLYGTPGKTYVVNGVVLNGKGFDGRGCVIQDAAGAPFCFRLTGFNPILRNIQIQDQGNCAKVGALSANFAAGASSITASATGMQAGQAVLIQDNSDWEVTQISAVSGSTLTLASAISSAVSSGFAVVASFGLVHLTDSQYAVIDTVLVDNCTVGLVMSTSSATGAEVAEPIIRDIRTPNARYAAAIKQGNVHDVNFKGLTSFSGTVATFDYVGGGVAGSFGVGYAVDLTSDLTVTVNGVAQVYGTNFELTDSYTITFLAGSYPAVGAPIVISNDHAGVRGFVEDQRNTIVSGGNIFSDFRLEGNIIALECQSVQLSNYSQIVLDTNQNIGLLLNNCGFDLNFDQLSSTYARQPIVAFNSGRVKFGSLETDQTPLGYINPFMALGAYEIQADSTSYLDIDLAAWESPAYLYSLPGNIKLKGGRQIVFSSATAVAAGSTVYLGGAGQQPQYAPLDIAADNGFVVAFYASVNVAPGASQTVTFNLIKNIYSGSPTTVLSYVISGASIGGFFAFTPPALATFDTLDVEVIYSSGAASSYPRGFFIRR